MWVGLVRKSCVSQRWPGPGLLTEKPLTVPGSSFAAHDAHQPLMIPADVSRRSSLLMQRGDLEASVHFGTVEEAPLPAGHPGSPQTRHSGSIAESSVRQRSRAEYAASESVQSAVLVRIHQDGHFDPTNSSVGARPRTGSQVGCEEARSRSPSHQQIRSLARALAWSSRLDGSLGPAGTLERVRGALPAGIWH